LNLPLDRFADGFDTATAAKLLLNISYRSIEIFGRNLADPLAPKQSSSMVNGR
jgi:hypothetical protein